MEENDTLSDPDLTVHCQLLGASGSFDVTIPPRAKVAWLKNDIARELFPSGPPLCADDIKVVYCGRVLSDADVVGKTVHKGSIDPFVVVLEAQVDACMGAIDDFSPPTVDQKSLLYAMRWLMDHGHTAPELEAKSREVEEVVGFFRQNNDFVISSDVLDMNHLYAAPAPEAPPPLPEIPPPRWVDLYLLVKVTLGVYLFAENLPLPAQIALGISYYCFSTGIFLYFWRLFSRHVIKNDTPFQRPLAAFAAGAESTGVPKLFASIVLVPSNPGIFWDICSVFGALLFSLYPGWYPRVATPPEPSATQTDAAAAPADALTNEAGNNEAAVGAQPEREEEVDDGQGDAR